MPFEPALRARLKADPVIQAAGATVEWSRRPQGAAYPAIVLTTVYDPRNRTMTGRQGFIPLRLYIDVMVDEIKGGSPTKAALREAILALIGFGEVRSDTRFWPARSVSVTDLSEQTDTQFIHRDQIDAIIPYRTEI